MSKSLLMGLLAMTGAGCMAADTRFAGTTSASLDESLVQAIVSAAEQQQPVSLILIGPEVPEGIARAAADIRPTRRADTSKIEGLERGHLLLQGASIGPNVATISGRLGPVPQPQPGVALLSCGTGFTVVFEEVIAGWQERELQTLEC